MCSDAGIAGTTQRPGAPLWGTRVCVCVCVWVCVCVCVRALAQLNRHSRDSNKNVSQEGSYCDPGMVLALRGFNQL